MKLSVSVRMAEARTNEPSPMKYEDFLALAKQIGYDAICMRASQGGIYSTLERLYEMARLTKASGLRVSMVTPDYPVPANTDQAADCLRNITPYLDVAQIFGSDMIRVGMKKDDDIPWAQRAADEARERKIRLVHHAEFRTLFATFDESMRTLKAVNRRNFGFVHDECQWMVNTKNYRTDQIVERTKAISPWLWNVYVKNQPAGPGPEGRPEISLLDKNGVDWDKHFEGLYAIRYTGYLTVHSKTPAMGPPEQAAASAYQFLKPFSSKA